MPWWSRIRERADKSISHRDDPRSQGCWSKTQERPRSCGARQVCRPHVRSILHNRRQEGDGTITCSSRRRIKDQPKGGTNGLIVYKLDTFCARHDKIIRSGREEWRPILGINQSCNQDCSCDQRRYWTIQHRETSSWGVPDKYNQLRESNKAVLFLQEWDMLEVYCHKQFFKSPNLLWPLCNSEQNEFVGALLLDLLVQDHQEKL